MVTTQRKRRKRCRRRVAARRQSDDEVDDANYVNYVWSPLTGISLMVLAISVVLRAIGSSIEDVFLTLYALACLLLFAGTTSYVVQTISQDTKDSSLNLHIDRKRTFREAVRGAATMVFFLWVLYLPALFIPVLVFGKEWLAYLALLIATALLVYGALVIVGWWWYHTVKSE